MTKEILSRVKHILRDHGEIFFPVRDLYNNRLLSPDLPPLDQLIRELKAQPDLVVTQNLKNRDENDPVVMLKERIPTLDEIIAQVRASLGGTLENLDQAYTSGIGQMAPDEEDLLLEAMQRTKKLGEEMERMFAEAKLRSMETDTEERTSRAD